MVSTAIYTILSVVIVSLVSLIGVFSLSFYKKFLKKAMILMVSLSAGTLFGGAFLHLLPEAVEEVGFSIEISLIVLAGIIVFFILEKIIHMHHHHHEDPHIHHHRPKPVGILNLVGDGVHNFLDGLIIAAAFLISLPAGIATTIAVFLHEIPQEIADYGVLIYAGFTRHRRCEKSARRYRALS